jgi:predicted small lipoprotein YifL
MRWLTALLVACLLTLAGCGSQNPTPQEGYG